MSKEILKLQNGSDIRGVAIEGVEGEDVTLTANSAAKIGKAFVEWFCKKTGEKAEELKIGLGRDSRITGPSLLNAMSCGILSAGANVVRCELATTPAMFMSIVFEQTKFDASAMITASHLPFNRNGIKLFNADGGLEHEDITEILEIAAEISDDEADNILDKQLEKSNDAPRFDLLTVYAEHLKNAILKGCNAGDTPLKGLHIVVDSGNGASGFFVDKILKPLGANAEGSQFLEPDGMFPNHIPNP